MRALAAVLAVVTGGVLPVFLVGGLSLQLRDELDFAEAGLGTAVAVFFLAAAAASAAFGRLAERLGPTASMRCSACLSAAALGGIAIGAHSYESLILLLIVAGLANAMTQPAANLFIARTIPDGRLGIAFALKQAGIPAGTLLSGAAVPALGLTVGWRWAFAGAAVLAAIGALAVPRSGAITREARRGARPRRTLALLALGVGFGAATGGMLGAFIVSTAVDAGISAGRAGALAAVGSAVCIAVRLVAGRRADRRDGGHLRVVALMMLTGAVGYVLLALGTPAFVLLATPIAFGAGWGWPGLSNLAVVRANPEAPGAASGLVQTGTYVGAVFGPLSFGWIAEHRSYGAGWCFAAACAVIGACAVTASRRLLRAERLASEAELLAEVAP